MNLEEATEARSQQNFGNRQANPCLASVLVTRRWKFPPAGRSAASRFTRTPGRALASEVLGPSEAGVESWNQKQTLQLNSTPCPPHSPRSTPLLRWQKKDLVNQLDSDIGEYTVQLRAEIKFVQKITSANLHTELGDPRACVFRSGPLTTGSQEYGPGQELSFLLCWETN